MTNPILTPLLAQNLDGLPAIRHGFFTREGGVSDGIYASLNCGAGSSDERDRVLENRRRVASHLGGTGGNIVTLYQEHGSTALSIQAFPSAVDLPRADAVVSATPGLVVGVLTADCAPVLFADAEARVVAAAHAGWRGALGGILESAILEMERLGARRDRIAAAVGPCIGQHAYEVGPEFEAQFLATAPGAAAFFARDGASAHPHFDLGGFVAHCLREARIPNIARLDVCTYENESLFYSYRRKTRLQEPDYGRQISAIVVA